MKYRTRSASDSEGNISQFCCATANRREATHPGELTRDAIKNHGISKIIISQLLCTTLMKR